MDLATYGAIISTAAFGLAVWSLLLHRARWKQDQADRQPELVWSTDPIKDLPDWRRLRVTLRNRSDTRIKADRIRIVWPPAARMELFHSLKTEEDTATPWAPGKRLPPEDPKRVIDLTLEVAHAGKPAEFRHGGWQEMGTGDTHWVDLVVSSPRNARVIFWISFSSFDRSLRIKSRRIST